MNSAQREAIKSMIGNHEDNLYRYELAEQRQPGSKNGNGELFSETISDLKRSIAELKEGL